MSCSIILNMMNILGWILKPIRWFFSSWKKGFITLVILGILGYFGYQTFGTTKQQPTYQTAQAEKGTLVTSITFSGNMTTGNSVSITTSASGIVNQVFVKNGDTVSQGQEIADITLDLSSQQKQAAAWASYLQSKTSLDAASAKLNSLQ